MNDFDRHHVQILRMASSVSGNVWIRAVQNSRADDLVSWGLAIRVSRSQYRLTERGLEVRQGLRLTK